MDLNIKELTITRDCLINEIGTLETVIKNQSDEDKKECKYGYLESEEYN